MFPNVPAAAVLTGAAGLVHMAAAVTHVGDSVALGLVFALAGWAQMVTAVWLAADRGRLALAALSLTNVAALAAWVASRTVGLPLLHPGVEPLGTADALTAALEALALAAAALLLRRRDTTGSVRRALPLGAVAAAAVALGASGAAVASLGSGGGHGHEEAAATAAADEAHGHGDDGGAGAGDAAPGHDDPAGEPSTSTSEEGAGASRQPGTEPARLHRHTDGIYHLHDDVELHRHDGGIVHVHTTSRSGSPSPSPGTEDHHDDGGHAH